MATSLSSDEPSFNANNKSSAGKDKLFGIMYGGNFSLSTLLTGNFGRAVGISLPYAFATGNFFLLI